MPFEGYGGAVYLDAEEGTPSEFIGVKRWRVREEADKEDITQMGQGDPWKRYAATLKGGSVTVEAFADSTETRWRDTAPVVSGGQSLDIELYFDEAEEEYAYTGTVLVDSVEAVLAVDGILNLTIEATLDGALVYPTTPA